MSLDLRNVCRVCVQSSENFVPLFDTSYGFSVPELMLRVTHVEVLSDDPYPQMICERCIKQFEIMNILIENCQTADRYFKSTIRQFDVKHFDIPVVTTECPPEVTNGSAEANCDASQQKLNVANEHPPTEDVFSTRLDSNVEDLVQVDPIGAVDINREPNYTQCCGCVEHFENFDTLQKHSQMTHLNEKGICGPVAVNLIECSICFKMFSGISYLDSMHRLNAFKHRLVSVGVPSVMQCCSCEVVVSNHDQMLEHARQHEINKTQDDGSQPYECRYCFKRYNKRQTLSFHQKFSSSYKKHLIAKQRGCRAIKKRTDIESTNESRICCGCSAEFPSVDSLTQHSQMHHELYKREPDTENPFECEICFKQFPTLIRLEQHRLVPYMRSHKCTVCNKSFPNQTLHKKHMEMHKKQDIAGPSQDNRQSQQSYSCEECGKLFNSKYVLQSHLKSKHSEIKPYGCSLCPRRFKGKQMLQTHLRVHTKEEPYTCAFCPKTFIQLTDKKRHEVNTHSKQYPLRCSVCDKGFPTGRRKELEKHERLHQNGEEYPLTCQFCDRTFTRIAQRNRHQARHVAERDRNMKQKLEEIGLVYFAVHNLPAGGELERPGICLEEKIPMNPFTVHMSKGVTGSSYGGNAQDPVPVVCSSVTRKIVPDFPYVLMCNVNIQSASSGSRHWLVSKAKNNYLQLESNIVDGMAQESKDRSRIINYKLLPLASRSPMMASPPVPATGANNHPAQINLKAPKKNVLQSANPFEGFHLSRPNSNLQFNINVGERMDICRACMEDDGVTYSQLFTAPEDSNCEKLCPAEMMADCTGITIRKSDGLPEVICGDCFNAIKIAYTIRSKCRNSDRKLRKILNIISKADGGLESAELENNVMNVAITDINYESSYQQEIVPENSAVENVSSKNTELFQNDLILKTETFVGSVESSHECVERESVSPIFMKLEILPEEKNCIKEQYIVEQFDEIDNETQFQQSVDRDDQMSLKSINEADTETGEENFEKQTIPDENESVLMQIEMLEDDETEEEEDHYEDYEAIEEELAVETISNLQSCGTVCCCGCPLEFANEEQLVDHAQLIHLQDKKPELLENSVFCEICFKIFGSLNALKMHKTHRFNKISRTCKCCTLVLSSIQKRKQHEKMHEFIPETFEIKCCGCNEMITLEELGNHIDEAHKRNDQFSTKFICPFCYEGFEEKKNLENHLYWQEITKLFKMSNKQEMPVVKLTSDVDGKERFVCDLCGKDFSTKGNLKSHRNLHDSAQRQFKCEHCEKDFTKKSNLNVHILRAHTVESMFPCAVCNKSFKYSSNLKIHMRVHTKERPYSCEHCSKTFIHLSDKRRHEILHSGDYPFKCQNCGKPFARKTLFDRHSTGCGKRGRRSESGNVRSEKHRLQPAELTKVRCDLCNSWFTSVQNLADHRADMHIQSLDEGLYDTEIEVE
ncbi:uncharacterized protein LOC129742326 [Uranotaenia lowii]|uniref:uncharacterized protein LOC129742326 n=1 Tax=Uranotaenia lowii TaxID=190385 RepID=UPI00247AA9D6|nr:uncharacterized protein LOC129742326 [Uranotaenia lowii]